MKKEYNEKNVNLNLLTVPFYGIYYFYKIGFHKNENSEKYYAVDDIKWQQVNVIFGMLQGVYFGILALALAVILNSL